MLVYVKNIEWDVDIPGYNANLPEAVDVDLREFADFTMRTDLNYTEAVDLAMDRLSNQYGWCIRNAEFEFYPTEPHAIEVLTEYSDLLHRARLKVGRETPEDFYLKAEQDRAFKSAEHFFNKE